MTDTPTAVKAWVHRRDQGAARWLVTTHRPLVLRTIRGWLPDGAMAEDVAQEVFIKAFKALPGLVVVEGRIDAWLCCIARNACANFLRGWKRRFVFPASECGIEDFSEVPAPADERCEVNEALRNDSLGRLLERLHEQDRHILWLYHAEGLTADAVGRRVGLSAGTVRVRAMRSQRALRGEARKLRARGRL